MKRKFTIASPKAASFQARASGRVCNGRIYPVAKKFKTQLSAGKLMLTIFHPFGLLKVALRGRGISCDVKASVHQLLRVQPKTFLLLALKRWYDAGKIASQRKVYYVEKCCNLF